MLVGFTCGYKLIERLGEFVGFHHHRTSELVCNIILRIIPQNETGKCGYKSFTNGKRSVGKFTMGLFMGLLMTFHGMRFSRNRNLKDLEYGTSVSKYTIWFGFSIAYYFRMTCNVPVQKWEKYWKSNIR